MSNRLAHRAANPDRSAGIGAYATMKISKGGVYDE